MKINRLFQLIGTLLLSIPSLIFMYYIIEQWSTWFRDVTLPVEIALFWCPLIAFIFLITSLLLGSNLKIVKDK